jgi:tRNA (guanine37-N1)-methyltransferase
MSKTADCIRVSTKNGQTAIALTRKLGLFDTSLEIQHDPTSLCIPLCRQPGEAELEKLQNEVPTLQLCQAQFVEKQVVQETLAVVLENTMPPSMLASLPQALDVIGDIAILEIPAELESYKKAIGEAILKTHRNVKTVLAKAGAINGIYRTREYNHIAGENRTRTIHKEFGCQYHVDVAKAYFSPRLSHEHERVASLVQSGETVMDLFAGVGPFSVLIGKRNPQVKVYAVDLNIDAVELLKVNVRVNRVENRVFPVLADAREISSGKLRGVADRVIMNLPETAIDFVDAACLTLKTEGGTVHFYAFVRAPKTIEELKYEFSKAAEASGRKVDDFLVARSIRETAPYESQIVLDAKIARQQ